MKKEIIEVPVLSSAVRAMGLPLSLVTKANGMVYVSGMAPLDIQTGKIVRGDIETQTEASLMALRHCLEAAGTTMENVVSVRVYAANAGFYNAINRVYAKHFRREPAEPHLRIGLGVADGDRPRDRGDRGGLRCFAPPLCPAGHLPARGRLPIINASQILRR